MRLKTWLVAASGLGSLVVLIAVSMLPSSRKTQDIYAQLDQLNAHHRNVEAKLRVLRSDVRLSSIFVRDNLLDVARERAPEYREQLAEFRRTSVATFEELGPLVGRDDQISSLQAKLAEYWETLTHCSTGRQPRRSVGVRRFRDARSCRVGKRYRRSHRASRS